MTSPDYSPRQRAKHIYNDLQSGEGIETKAEILLSISAFSPEVLQSDYFPLTQVYTDIKEKYRSELAELASNYHTQANNLLENLITPYGFEDIEKREQAADLRNKANQLWNILKPKATPQYKPGNKILNFPSQS